MAHCVAERRVATADESGWSGNGVAGSREVGRSRLRGASGSKRALEVKVTIEDDVTLEADVVRTLVAGAR